MYSFFVDPGQIGETSAFISGSDVRHISQVLRMKTGDKILISNGNDVRWACQIAQIGKEQIQLQLLDKIIKDTELPAHVVLYQGISKGDKMEWLIQKNVELGVDQIVPVMTNRTVVKWDAKKAEAKVKRYRAIAESSAKQAKRRIIPQISDMKTFKEALESARDFDLKLFPYENMEGIESTRQLINQMRVGQRIAFFIGPEGGFNEAEVAQAVEYGFKPVSLGRRILRTETAGMTLMAAIMLHLDER